MAITAWLAKLRTSSICLSVNLSPPLSRETPKPQSDTQQGKKKHPALRAGPRVTETACVCDAGRKERRGGEGGGGGQRGGRVSAVSGEADLHKPLDVIRIRFGGRQQGKAGVLQCGDQGKVGLAKICGCRHDGIEHGLQLARRLADNVEDRAGRALPLQRLGKLARAQSSFFSNSRACASSFFSTSMRGSRTRPTRVLAFVPVERGLRPCVRFSRLCEKIQQRPPARHLVYPGPRASSPPPPPRRPTSCRRGPPGTPRHALLTTRRRDRLVGINPNNLADMVVRGLTHRSLSCTERFC